MGQPRGVDKHLFLEDCENAWYLVPGTKTEDNADYIPLHPDLVDELLKWREVCSTKRFAFPGVSARTKGKKIYSRARMLNFLREKAITSRSKTFEIILSLKWHQK